MCADHIKVSYFSNELTIKDIPDDKAEAVQDLWVKLREDYADWVSEVRLKSFKNNETLVEMLEWKGMSTWWINNLVRKDSDGDTEWLHRLMVMYFCDEFKGVVEIETDDKILISSLRKNIPDIGVSLVTKKKSFKEGIKSKIPSLLNYMNLSRSLYGSIRRKLLVLGASFSIGNGININKKNIWFMTTYPANWVKNHDDWYDRHLVDSPLQDSLFEMQASYLVYILSYSKDHSLSFLKLRKELLELKNKAGRDVFFPESQLLFKDIVGVYWSTLLEWIKFRSWKKNKKFNELFQFSDMDLSLILTDHWENSYFGVMQYCKLHGLSTMRFLELMGHKQTIVTYLELFIETRADYHLKNTTIGGAVFYALQHSQESRNYGEAYNRKSEFAQHGSKNHIHYCPAPDFFLVHGKQYKNILSEFYLKSKIRIIGNVKVKKYLNSMRLDDKTVSKINSELLSNDKPKIIVALSLNDDWFLLKLLSSWVPEQDIQIWMTLHPSNNNERVISWVNNELSHLKIKLITDFSTWEILSYADVLICGYSSLIYEALLFNIPIAVLQPLSLFSPREIDPRIVKFYNMKLFDMWINELLISEKNIYKKEYYDSIFCEYFFQPDGDADKRMWKTIAQGYNNSFPIQCYNEL